ncbi:MAG: sulfite exporter TauE/SafE family protein [Bacteroidia bacterium]
MSIIAIIGLLALGCTGGFLAGLMGVGGGLIFIPVLDYLFRNQALSPDEVVRYTLANSIFLVFASGLSGIFRQYRMGSWAWRESLHIGIPGALSSWAMSWAIRQGSWYSTDRFSLVFLGFLILTMGNMLFSKGSDQGHEGEATHESWHRGSLVGLLAGAVVSLSGLGGGIIMVPLFRMLLKKPMHKATSLSLSIVPMLASLSLFHYLRETPETPLEALSQSGYMVWPYFLPIAVGVLVFSSFGQKKAKDLSPLTLRIIFASLSGLVLIKTVYQLLP